jgi:hypothetical protein
MSKSDTRGPDLYAKYAGYHYETPDGTVVADAESDDPPWIETLTDIEDRPRGDFISYLEATVLPALRARIGIGQRCAAGLTRQAHRYKSTPEITDREAIRQLIAEARAGGRQ